MEEVKALLRQIIKNQNDLVGIKEVELCNKWQHGKMILQPGEDTLKPVELPIENLFKKVISIREKLRVLEQKINNHPSLTSTEKIDMEQYITKCYGSLTTFNILFKYQDDKFKGQSS